MMRNGRDASFPSVLFNLLCFAVKKEEEVGRQETTRRQTRGIRGKEGETPRYRKGKLTLSISKIKLQDITTGGERVIILYGKPSGHKGRVSLPVSWVHCRVTSLSTSPSQLSPS